MSNVNAVGTAARLAGKRPFRVSIEGNIGSGKSTCIKFFEKYQNVEAHAEPLDEWRNVGGHNLLSLLYGNVNKWTFAFQHYVHLSRLKIQTSPPAHAGITVKMFERSVQNSRHCFVENARKQNYLEDPEYQVLMTWFDYSEKNLDIDLDLIVYLRTTPEVVYERMRRRGRAEEADVPLDYLREVHSSYESWLMGAGAGAGAGEAGAGAGVRGEGAGAREAGPGCEVLAVDADRGLARVAQDLATYQYKILGGNHTH